MSNAGASSQRPPYSPRFLERYGRSLQREETILVQAYRNISEKRRDALLAYVSSLVLSQVRQSRRVR